MSASREKKQRTDNVGDLTPRQLRELKEAQDKKRNQILYTVLGVVAAAAVIALLVWNSGLFQKGQTAATVNEQSFSVAQVAYYYGYVRQDEVQLANLYQQFGLSTTGMFNPSQPAKQQIQDAESGKTYAQYFQEQALETLKRVVVLCDQAQAEGYTLSDAGRESVDAVVSTMKQNAAQNSVSLPVYLKSVFGKYMTESVFREEALRSTLADEYQNTKGESFTYGDDQLDAYYKEHSNTMDTYDYYYAKIDGAAASAEATDAEKTGAMSAAKEKAEAMAAELEGGAEFAQAAMRYVSDAEKASYEADSEYRHQTGDLGSALTSSSYGQWLTSTDSVRRSGDIGVVEDAAGSCYYVVKLINRWRAEDTYATVDARHILIKAQLDEGASEPTQAQYEAAKARIEELKAQWESDGKTAESFAQLATLHSDDTGSKADGGLITGIAHNQTVANFNDFLFTPGRKAGDVGVVQNTASGQQGYHLIYIDALGDLSWKATAENALRGDDYTAWYEDVAESYEATASDGMAHLAK